MGLLDGNITELFGTAFGGLYLSGTLHKGTGEPTFDETTGLPTGYTGADQSIKVQTDRTSDALKSTDGYSPGDARLIVLAQGLTATINRDSEITDGYGDKWRVKDVDQDAARSHFILLAGKA